ncbi:hypothetical protein DBR36_03300 [Microbacterium sp. HMWF026]|uniref:hypothetical protein n=1 Tax=Microbacterium sp. HMWF026 TaxID=2056861 RepID=UPI000D34C372|nr:hypothetical protein [Microbacterium sp. HMWF026]PTT21762.1 hypothetical protein DBR36_03300 [Microbacterium sp. HMWF026]
MTHALPATTKLYWYVVAGGAVMSVVAAATVSALYNGVMGGGHGAITLSATVGAGLSFGLLTTVFVILGTVWFASKLHTRKGWTIAMSVAAPVVGWTLFGVFDSGFGPASLFVFYPVVGVIAGVASGTVVALGSFLVPENARQLEMGPPDDTDVAELFSRER